MSVIDNFKRPVKCALCEKQMYYHGNPKWEAELSINGIDGCDFHMRCWKRAKKLMKVLKGHAIV